MPKRNCLKFVFTDNTHLDDSNESCEIKKYWIGEREEGQVLSIEDYYIFCREFAAALGFVEGTINEWFGEY